MLHFLRKFFSVPYLGLIPHPPWIFFTLCRRMWCIPFWYNLLILLCLGSLWCHQHVFLAHIWYSFPCCYALFKRWPLTLFLTLWKLENNLLGTPRAHKPFQGWFMDNSSIFCKCFSCSDLKTLKLHFLKLRISIFEEGIFGSFLGCLKCNEYRSCFNLFCVSIKSNCIAAKCTHTVLNYSDKNIAHSLVSRQNHGSCNFQFFNSVLSTSCR